LEPLAVAEPVAAALAALQGCEAATLAPSTLHLFWDLIGILSEDGTGIAMDGATYAIARWGVERAAQRGVPVRGFAHHDAVALGRLVDGFSSSGLSPLVVTDGFCPLCGTAAPLPAYLDRIRPTGGCLVVDDTQALGILGRAPGPELPYGRHGGGSLPWYRLYAPDIVLASSLAKGFGVPLAVLSGARRMIERFERLSATRVHCSPPSAAVLAAAESALRFNRLGGDTARRRLGKLVCRFREGLNGTGLRLSPGLFPVQTVQAREPGGTALLHRRLGEAGICTVLLRGHSVQAPQVGILITAEHRGSDIDCLVEALISAAGSGTSTIQPVEYPHVQRW